MHGAGIAQPRRVWVVHGPLHGMEVGDLVAAVDGRRNGGLSGGDQDIKQAAEIDGDGAGGDGVVGIAQIPGQVVLVAEDVATGAGCLAIAGKAGGIVEERPAGDDRSGSGLGSAKRADFRPRRGRSPSRRRRSASWRRAAARLVENQAARAAAAEPGCSWRWRSRDRKCRLRAAWC